MHTRSAFFLLLAVGLAALGCKSKPSLVGDWSGTFSVQGVEVNAEFKFGGDGTVQIVQTAMGQSSTQKGTYTSDEKQFTVTETSVESATMPKAMLDQVNSTLQKTPRKLIFDCTWKDNDTISITQRDAPAPMNLPITLKRKK
jgi:hypothetical protein